MKELKAVKIMKYFIKKFGELNDITFDEIIIENDNNQTISFTNYGARINRWLPDKNDESIIIDNSNLNDLVKNRQLYSGASIGRVAGRIKNAIFKLNNNVYKLKANDGNNHIHGGEIGYDNQKWKYEVIQEREKISIKFKTIDKSETNGYPGDLDVCITHSFDNNNIWEIKYEAVSNQDTLFNPTNHVYFNLNENNNESVLNHELTINANNYLPIDKSGLPLGNIYDVRDTPFNFKNKKNIREIFKMQDEQVSLVNGLDHPFLLKDQDSKPDAILECKNTNKKIIVNTDRPSIVIYTLNKGKEFNLNNHSGLALETQVEPNAVNEKEFNNILLKKNQLFRSVTSYKLIQKVSSVYLSN